MRFLFKKRSGNDVEFGLIYGGIALLLLCAARLLPVLDFLPSCPFHDLTGMPCPSCGSSRSLVHLAQGDIASSMSMNPLAALCYMAAICWFLYTLVSLVLDIPRITVQFTEKGKSTARFSALFFVFINWLYLAVLA